jgi:nitrite reductase/ring-hydroxylating ferredoxin subunit
VSEATAGPLVLCRLCELSDPGSRAFSIGSGDWPLRGFLVRSGDDVFAFVNRCPHAGHLLNMRPDEFLSPDKSVILCHSHGAMFEISSGACVQGPCFGQALIPLPIRMEKGSVLLDGDPEELSRQYA